MNLTKEQKKALEALTGEPQKKGFFEGATSLAKKAAIGAKDIGVGAVKEATRIGAGVAETVAKIQKPSEKLKQYVTKAVLPKSIEESAYGKSLGLNQPTRAESAIQATQAIRTSPALQPTNTAQKIGGTIANVASFAAPATQASRATQASQAVQKLPVIGRGLANMASQGLTSAGTQLATSGLTDTEGAKATGVITAGATGTLGLLGTVARPIARSISKPKTTKELFNYLRSSADDVEIPKTTVNKLLRANPQQKSIFQEMQKKAVQRSVDDTAEQPIVAIGKRVLNEYQELQNNTRQVGRLLDNVKKQIDKNPKVINIAPVQRNLNYMLNQLRIKTDPKTKELIFPGSVLGEERKIITTAFEKIKQIKNSNQALDLVEQLGKELDVATLSNKIAPKTKFETLLTDLRSKLVNSIGKTNKEYVDLNKKYAVSKQAVDQIKKALKDTGFSDKASQNIKAAEIVRPLINRNTSRPTQLLNDMYKALNIYKPKISPSQRLKEIQSQINFSDVLEKVYDIKPPSSFVGGIESGITKAGQELAQATTTPKFTILNKIDKLFGRDKVEVAKEIIETALKDIPQVEANIVNQALERILPGLIPAITQNITSSQASQIQQQNQPTEQIPSIFTPLDNVLPNSSITQEEIPSIFTPLN
jgi:hypothetical protein